MAEMNAVVGYVSDAVAKGIGTKRQQGKPLEVRLEPGGDVHVRINPEDVAGVLLGSSQKGQTSIQVLVNDKATVETFARDSAASILKQIRDPRVWPQRPPLVAIYVSPQYIDKLVDLNKQGLKTR